MAYRHQAVIPANFPTSMPERCPEHEIGRLRHLYDLGHPRPLKKPIHCRYMTTAGILLACSAITMFLAGAPLASQEGSIQESTQAGTQAAIQNWSFDIFPMAGAMMAAAGICLLHNEKEGVNRIAGRVIFALLGGFVAPWLVDILPLEWKIIDPRGQLLVGVAAGSVGYIFSKYFVEIVFKRAFGISEKIVDAGERRLNKELEDS